MPEQYFTSVFILILCVKRALVLCCFGEFFIDLTLYFVIGAFVISIVSARNGAKKK